MVDIHGAWAAGRYRFMQRYRSGMQHNLGEEFDAPFARIDRMGQDHPRWEGRASTQRHLLDQGALGPTAISASRAANAAVSTPIRWRSSSAFSVDHTIATAQAWKASGSTAISPTTTQ